MTNWKKKAFPSIEEGVIEDGMNLEDWFAGMALQGILSDQTPPDTFNPERDVKTAYLFSALMMKERKK